MISRRRDETPIELQIAPMADIGFLLICFFLISSKPPRHEADLGMTLPGSVSDEVSVEMPDEVRVAIRADGAVEVNEAIVGEPGDHEIKPLVNLLIRFKEAADLNHSKALVTVDAANESTHQRIVDVLNACGTAGITGVTLSDDTTEEN
ncbi:biopolymer transporter ExbD [Luteolibacter pohnpeiensis]|uniref:Biopolymer transporter ExbD n=1 Tax=Luteolibacter pohnpeiensis TaxID=454153 RepID=A0A934SD63_9BACT|nr:biopolymer transporter ExbD [Luteolibacter pohnpeiensis]MBK1883962.1 biopolymer transporter ExbD [Luteolibacter pohnpeiensis]